MGRPLAAGIDAIMATDAVVDNRAMIHHRGFPLGGAVARTAIIGRWYMGGYLAGRPDAIMTTVAAAKHLGVIHGSRSDRSPGYGCRLVTGFAPVSGCKMGSTFAGSDLAVMAHAAGGGDLAVIDTVIGHREPGRGEFVVAELALIAGRHVQRTLAAGAVAIVATDAVVDNGGVIHRRRQPLSGTVASATVINRRDMIGVLAGGNVAIMATHAGAPHLGMIHGIRRHRRPGQRAAFMTSIAVIGGIDMVGKLAGIRTAIVAADASAQYLIVIHRGILHRSPQGRRFVMAQLAFIGGRQMRTRLATGIETIVASDTAAIDEAMIDGAQGPGDHRMADITLFGGRQMTVRLAGRGETVMAAAAHSQHLGVIDIRRRHRGERHGRLVTSFALRRGSNVGRRL